MKKLLICLLFIFINIDNTSASEKHKIIQNHVFETYTEQQINDNIYTIHPYEKLNYSDWTIMYGHIHKWTTIWFYIWGNKIVTQDHSSNNDLNKWLYIVCKPKAVNNFLSEECIWTAQLDSYNRTTWLALLEIEWLTWKGISNTEDKNHYIENWFKSYGMRYADHSDLDLSIDVFQDDIKVFYYEWEKWLHIEEGNFLANTVVFYNNSFFWINWWIGLISKSNILDHLDKKWNFTEYAQDETKYNSFENEAHYHIKNLESYKEKIGVWHISFSDSKSWMYENEYIINNYESLVQSKLNDWIYLWIQAHQNDFEGKYDQMKIYYSNKDYQWLQNTLTGWADVTWIKLIRIDSEKFTIKASDLFNEYEWKNTHFRIKMYIKSWDSYYSNWTYLSWYFWLNKVGKIYNWLLDVDWTIDYFSTRKIIKDFFLKKFSNLNDDEIANIKSDYLNKLSEIEKIIDKKLLLFSQNINNEDEFIKNNITLQKYKNKLTIVSLIQEILWSDSSGSDLFDMLGEAMVEINSDVIDMWERTKIYVWE